MESLPLNLSENTSYEVENEVRIVMKKVMESHLKDLRIYDEPKNTLRKDLKKFIQEFAGDRH